MISITTFNIAEIIKKINGDFESPMLRKVDAYTLYKNVKITQLLLHN